jgi:lipoic acid synthetase
MLGLGEERQEVVRTLEDLRDNGCHLVTMGQYLQPSRLHHPVERFVPPAEFEELKEIALDMGFKAVASGPFVRSSYKAGEMLRSIGK